MTANMQHAGYLMIVLSVAELSVRCAPAYGYVTWCLFPRLQTVTLVLAMIMASRVPIAAQATKSLARMSSPRHAYAIHLTASAC